MAKGPFSDKYVRRDLREIISSEAGANDGFGFPFLLYVYLIQKILPCTNIPSYNSDLQYISSAMQISQMSSSKRESLFRKLEPPYRTLFKGLPRQPQKRLTIPRSAGSGVESGGPCRNGSSRVGYTLSS